MLMDDSKPPEAPELASLDSGGVAGGAPKSGNDDAAAVTMQKNYRGYRLRRQLADCAVDNIAKDYRWWNVLEGVCLQKNIEADEHEDAHHKWKRVGLAAAKLGRGLSKDETALKLAFQHWLEAVDPRHRYGHNLTQYYNVWLKSGTTERFFYWLDVGAGKQVDLKECPRSKLCKEQISYLGPKQRRAFEASISDGVLKYTKSGKLIDTSDDDGEKWIFVMSPAGKLYVGQKKRGEFQHSSFLAGGAAKAAGRLLASNGVLKVIEPHSGHYRPTEKEFRSFQRQLESQGVDLAKVKIVKLKDKAKDEDSETVDFLSSNVSNFAAVVEALAQTSDNDDGASSSSNNITPEQVIVDDSKEQESKSDEDKRAATASKRPELFVKRPSFSWTSEGGARLSSLSVISHEERSKALDEIGTPRSEQGTPRPVSME